MGTPHQAHCPYRAYFCLSRHLSKLLTETQKTVTNFEGEPSPQKPEHSLCDPGAYICIPK